MRTLCVLLLVAVVSGCSVFGDDDRELGAFSSYEEYVEERADREADLARLIGDADASDLGVCRTVAVGRKACGGPLHYAVYSAEASDADAVERMAQAITDLDIRANRQFGLASTCDVTPVPEVVLADGQCRVR
jgi:hypothetical protein